MEISLLKLERGHGIEFDDDYIDDEFQGVEFKLVCPSDMLDERKVKVQQGLSEVEERLSIINQKVEELNSGIDTLTNHADGLDYVIAVASGVLTGLIDSFFVGEWNMTQARAWSSEEINKKITEFAQKDPEYKEFLKGRKDREDSSINAIEFLEKKYKLPGDNDWDVKTKLVNLAKEKGFAGRGYEDALKYMNEKFPKKGGWDVTDNFITKSTHHLDDLCHHPTVVGLICCIVVQFTGSSIYANKHGDIINLPVTVNEYGKFVGKNNISKMFAGVVNWFLNVARTMANRKGHLFSDMAGSRLSAKKSNDGMGLPGGFLSTMKELSALPAFKGTNFAENLRKAYQNGIGTGKSQIDLGAFNCLFDGAKFDMRTEMAIGHEVKRQAMPVVINEILVRGAYFVRRLIEEIKQHNGFSGISWNNVLPFNNRTIVRMITIASGTFTAVDMADAGIRAVVKSGGVNPATLGNFILNVNFVGVGRFAIAVVADVGMEIKKGVKENRRLALVGEQLKLMNIKVSYQQADMWLAAEDTGKTINEAYEMIVPAVEATVAAWEATQKDMEDISETLGEKRKEDAMLEAFMKMYGTE